MVLVFVEANIGAGKSTLLRRLQTTKFSFSHEVVEEPVNAWEAMVDEDGNSLFKKYYNNKKQYAFLFQIYVLSTRVKRIHEMIKTKKTDVVFCERSLLSDLMIFVKYMEEGKLMGVMETEVYKHVHDTVVSMLNANTHIFLYLRVDPHECMRRVKQRARGGEDVIDFTFLETLHMLHEQWLINDKVDGKTCDICVVDGNDDVSDVIAWGEKLHRIESFVRSLLEKK